MSSYMRSVLDLNKLPLLLLLLAVPGLSRGIKLTCDKQYILPLKPQVIAYVSQLLLQQAKPAIFICKSTHYDKLVRHSLNIYE